MPKRIVAIYLFLFLGTGSIMSQEKYTVDKVVAVVGSSSILYSDLKEAATMLAEERRKEGYTAGRDLMDEGLERLLLQKLLFNQAQVDSVQINLDAVGQQVEMRLSQMVEEAGSITELEERMGRPYYDIRQELKNRYEEMYYAQAMRNEVVSKVKITPGEVERFFRKLDTDSLPPIPEKYVYAQIVKYPTSSKAAKQRVREQLLHMRERIINGTRFDLLARMYSVDGGTAMKGGEMGWMPLDGLVEPFANALEKLQPGQISEVVETEYGYHIIELIDKKGDMYNCRHILLRPSYTPEELAADGRMLDSLANEIRGGKITFEEAARRHSDDRYSRENGGIVTNHELLETFGAETKYSSTKFMREELRNDYPALRNLSVGEISPSFQSQDFKNNELNKIVKLVEIIPSHTPNMKDDYLEIEQLALAAKQEEEFEKWVNRKIEGLFVRIEPEFRDGDFLNKSWIK